MESDKVKALRRQVELSEIGANRDYHQSNLDFQLAYEAQAKRTLDALKEGE